MNYEIHTSDMDDETPIGDIWAIRAVEHFEVDFDAPRPVPASPFLAALLRGVPPVGDGKRTRVLMTSQTGIPAVETLPGHWELSDFGELVVPPLLKGEAIEVHSMRAIGGGGGLGGQGSTWAVSGGSGGSGAGGGGGISISTGQPTGGSAWMAVTDVIGWLNDHSRARNSGTRTAHREVAAILERHGFAAPELEDLPPARLHQASPARKRARKSRKPQRRTTVQREYSAEVRDWAKVNGFAVSDHGRLPARVHQAFENRPAE